MKARLDWIPGTDQYALYLMDHWDTRPVSRSTKTACGLAARSSRGSPLSLP